MPHAPDVLENVGSGWSRGGAALMGHDVTNQEKQPEKRYVEDRPAF